MTRKEAIKQLKKDAFYYGQPLFKAIKAEQWGVAASLIIDYSDSRLDKLLADALWEGKK